MRGHVFVSPVVVVYSLQATAAFCRARLSEEGLPETDGQMLKGVHSQATQVLQWKPGGTAKP